MERVERITPAAPLTSKKEMEELVIGSKRVRSILHALQANSPQSAFRLWRA
jgi:hypothetical protein